MLGPALAAGRFAMQALPLITAGAAALPALRQGDPLGALVQGGLGYLTGGAVKGGAQGLIGAAQRGARSGAAATGLANAQTAVGQTFGLNAQKAAAGFLSPAGLRTAASIGIPLAAVAAVPMIANATSGAAQRVGQTAQDTAQFLAGLQQTQGPGAVEYGQNGIPSGTDRYGGYGGYSPSDVLLGQGLTQRLEYAKNIEATRDAMRLLNPEIFAASEARSKTEFQRQMAAAGIRQNIATAANMLERSQQAAQQMGATAASQAGSALTSQYQYQ
jgi:hypothetical protein